jgi:hypothetical protein
MPTTLHRAERHQAERQRAEPGAAVPADVLVTVPLSRGRVLVVRHIRRTDVDGIERLFDELTGEDRYFRFFSYCRPGRGFTEQMTRASEEGGCHLVAVVSVPAGAATEQTLVAEAGYVLLPDGNGEFALTVASGWRGWLGPYLLDVLVADAAARGIPNLQADILCENTRMLSLVSDRGYAVIGHDGPDVRVAIDAAQPRPRSRHGR